MALVCCELGCIDVVRWWTIQQLKSKDPKQRVKAIEKLSEGCGTADGALLLGCLRDDQAEVRLAALRVLPKVPDFEALEPLVSALSDPEADVRETAAELLGKLRQAAAIPPLENSLRDSASKVRYRSAKALEALGWQPANDVQQAWRHVALGEFEKAAGLGSAAVDPLAVALKDGLYHQRQAIVELLSHIGDARTVKLLMGALQDEDSNVRLCAIEALARMGEAEAVPAVIAALQDQDARVRAEAAEALSKFGDVQGIDPLLALLRDSQWNVRLAAVEALGKFRAARVVPQLVGVLQDSDHEVRESAVRTLQEIGDPLAIGPLVPLLKDDHSNVRSAAAAALRTLDPAWEQTDAARAALPELRAALKHKDYWVRQAAAETLAAMGEARPIEPLLAGLAVPSQLRRDSVFEVLAGLLGDADGDLRQAAAQCLGLVSDRRALRLLEQAMSDPDAWVRAAAAQALQQLHWQPPSAELQARWTASLHPV